MTAYYITILVAATLSQIVFVVASKAPSSDANDRACDATGGPRAVINGQLVAIDETRFTKHIGSYPPDTNGNRQAAAPTTTAADDEGTSTPPFSYYILNADKPVLYVTNFLNQSVVDELKTICIEGNRFVRSPIRQKASTDTQHDTHRTSESCTGVPAAMYLRDPKAQAVLNQSPMPPHIAKIKREVDLHWDVATKAASFLQSQQTALSVEPLQLVRYTSPEAEYKLHHDHGGFYHSDTDQRPWTMLVFLNSPPEGGHTAFPRLGLEVVPRSGDAVVWRNVIHSDAGASSSSSSSTLSLLGQADPDMVHAGLPPTVGEKYALNVWFEPSTTTDHETDGMQQRLQKEGRWSQ